jgi:hypothetical protein
MNTTKELNKFNAIRFAIGFFADERTALLKFFIKLSIANIGGSFLISEISDVKTGEALLYLGLFFIVCLSFCMIVLLHAKNSESFANLVGEYEELKEELTEKDKRLTLAQQINDDREARVEIEKHELRLGITKANERAAKAEARVKELEARVAKVEKEKDLAPLRLKNANEELTKVKARVKELEASIDLGIAKVINLEPRFVKYVARWRQKKDQLPEINFKQFIAKPEHYENLK